MTTTDDVITPTQRLTVLKHLAHGRDAAFVASVTKIPVGTVERLGNDEAGKPLAYASLRGAIRELQAQIDEEIRQETTTPTSTPAAAFERRQAVTRAPAEKPQSAHTPAPAAPAAAGPFASLLSAASKSKMKRTQQLGQKISAMLDDLAGRLDAESEAKREEAARAAEQARVASERKRERERIEAEVKAAEEALRRSKAKLRRLNGNRGRKPKAAT